MKLWFIALIGGLTVASGGCRKVTIVAEEIPVEDSSSQDTGTDTDTSPDGGADSESDSEWDSDTETETETGADTGTETESDTETETESDTETETESDTVEFCDVPDTFAWRSAPEYILPPSGYRSIKDPSVVWDEDRWLAFATTISNDDAFSMTYFEFVDWADAPAAEKTPVDINEHLSGYKAAPQLFFFRPDQTWYLVYQSSEPSYSTSKTPRDVTTWSEMAHFMPMPKDENGEVLTAIDYWVICDDTHCYLFFTAFNGKLYRTQTLKTDFPLGFDESLEVAIGEGAASALFDAGHVYKLEGTDTYLLIAEAYRATDRYFRSWTSDRLDGEWTPLADTVQNPFASVLNVDGAGWSLDGISHGELLRGNDETMTVNTCNYRFLFSGLLAPEDSYGIGLLRDIR